MDISSKNWNIVFWKQNEKLTPFLHHKKNGIFETDGLRMAQASNTVSAFFVPRMDDSDKVKNCSEIDGWYCKMFCARMGLKWRLGEAR